MLERERAYFEAHRADLYAEYADQHIVIVGEEVVDADPDVTEAYLRASERFEPGTFLIVRATLDDEERVQRFHSRVGSLATA